MLTRFIQSLLIQKGVKECLLQSDDQKADHELTKLRTLVQRCGVIVTERRPGASEMAAWPKTAAESL
jgi:hypothetical protein